MEAIEMIKGRRSIRKFSKEVVPSQVVRSIMEATRYTQSWANFQVARYTFITDEAKIEAIAKSGVNDFVYNMDTLVGAKNVMVLSFVRGKSGKLDPEGGEYATNLSNSWEVFDAGIACQTFCLAAHAMGVGTCVMGIIDHKVIGQVAELRENESVAALVVYGYPHEVVAPTPRKSVDELTRFLP